MIKIGSIVTVNKLISVVVKLFDNGDRKMARVHYLDPRNGKIFSARGNVGRTCPIDDLEAWPATRIDLYASKGMIDAEIAREAKIALFGDD